MSEQNIEQPRDDAGRFTPAADSGLRATEITTRMAEADRPFDAFEPMKMLEPVPPKEETFSHSFDGLRAAAAEVQKRRQEQAPVIERKYHDAQTKERMPVNQTRKLSEAASDLQQLRIAERDGAEALSNMSLAQRIDHFRQQADAEDRGQPVLEGDAVPEPQPEATPEAPQPMSGVDPEVAKALENPKICAALEQQAMAHENSRQQYLAAVQQLGNVQAAALLAEFPELQSSGNPRGTLELWRHSNPEKFAAVAGRLNQIQQVVNHWNGLQAQQQQQAAQNFQAYSKGEDSKFEEFEKSRPASEAKHVRDNLATVLKKDFGIDPQALSQLYNSVPQFRSVEAQKLIYAAVRHSLAEKAASKRGADPRVPKVFTPGDAASDRLTGASAVVQQKMAQFAANPNPRTAAKALTARRRAASVLR